MSNPIPLPPPGFARIAATPDQVPVPKWHHEILDERLKDYEANPNAGESWDVVREQLRDKLHMKRDPRIWRGR